MTIGGTNEQEKLKGLLKSVIQAENEKEQLGNDIKDYLDAIKNEFGIKPAKVRKAIKAIRKGNLPELKQELEEIEELVDLEAKISSNPMNN